MRAPQSVRTGEPLGPPAFAPVILLGACDLNGLWCIGIELYVTASGTNPGRQRRLQLPLEYGRFWFAECCDRQFCLSHVLTAVNGLGIGNDIARSTLRTFVGALHVKTFLAINARGEARRAIGVRYQTGP